MIFTATVMTGTLVSVSLILAFVETNMRNVRKALDGSSLWIDLKRDTKWPRR